MIDKNLHTVGKHFIVGLSGSTLTAEEENLLSVLRPAGIILFKRNILINAEWIETLQQLIAKAKAAAGRQNFFVSIDHEGGKVHRLPAPVTHFPEARKWGLYSSEVSRVMAQELRALSFNLNFFPVLDVDSEPLNPVIAKRAFSDKAHEVAERGAQSIRSFLAEGMLCCGKHFPGHGATTTDSHHELPLVQEPKEILQQRDLVPFVKAIEVGVPLIMTAHVMYPALDPRVPATLSRPIIEDLLRSELGFRGAVVSDALEMGALANVELRQVAKQSINAGVDLLLIAEPKGQHPLWRAVEMARQIVYAQDQGEISQNSLEVSSARIDQLFLQGEHLTKAANVPNITCLGSPESISLCARVSSA